MRSWAGKENMLRPTARRSQVQGLSSGGVQLCTHCHNHHIHNGLRVLHSTRLKTCKASWMEVIIILFSSSSLQKALGCFPRLFSNLPYFYWIFIFWMSGSARSHLTLASVLQGGHFILFKCQGHSEVRESWRPVMHHTAAIQTQVCLKERPESLIPLHVSCPPPSLSAIHAWWARLCGSQRWISSSLSGLSIYGEETVPSAF